MSSSFHPPSSNSPCKGAPALRKLNPTNQPYPSSDPLQITLGIKVFIFYGNFELTFQPAQPRFSEPILWQHAAHRPFQYLPPAPLLNHRLHIHRLQSSRPRGLLVVSFLLHLPAGNEDLMAASGDNVVTAIGRWVPDGLVLAHQQDRDARGYPPKGGGSG